MLTMWLKYSKKDKVKFLTIKFVILLLIIGSFVLAADVHKLKLPENVNKLGWYGGIITLIILLAAVLLNRIKILFRIRSLGFLILFGVLKLLEQNIEVAVTALGYVVIVLLIDDIVVNGYFYILNVNKYWEYYKDVIASERR